MWQTFPLQMQSMVIELRDSLSEQYDLEMNGAGAKPSFDMKVLRANTGKKKKERILMHAERRRISYEQLVLEKF